MSANIARVGLSLEAGADLAAKINPRLISLTLTEKRGGEADQLQITLHNHDGKLQAPAPGRILVLSLGWLGGDDVTVGLVPKGRFKVDEVELSGPPDVVTITARSADLVGAHRKRRTKAWKDTTLGAVVADIAARDGLTAQVHPDLASKPIAVLEQHGKSDVAFVRDLGRRYDALATWKDRKLIMMPIGSTTTASGKAIPGRTLTRKDGWTWRYTRAEREGADGTEAQYHDPAAGRRKTVKHGPEKAGTKRRRLKRVYASKAEADQAAKADLTRRKRAGFTFEYDLAFADCALQPNAPIMLSGWGTAIDSRKWLADSIETTFDGGGLKQKLSLETA